jgi:hypothetical protein
MFYYVDQDELYFYEVTQRKLYRYSHILGKRA